jgi:tetratricopeptide (TPR) repeat protein
MLTKQKKLSRKEIKEDKLVEFYYKSQSFFEENKNKVFTYLGAIVVVVFAVVMYMNYRGGQNDDAAAHLSKVMDIYETGDFLGAIEGKKDVKLLGLKEIVAQYGSTENGEIAKIYLANSYANLGKSDEALKYYEDYSGDIDIYIASSLAGQAGYYAAKNEYEKAADLYIKASKVDKTDVMNSDYMFQAAINYFDAGDKDQAKSILQTIKDEYKTSAVYSQVDRYLSQIN